MRISRLASACIALVAVLGLSSSVNAADPPLPNSIASTGDSITRAFDATWSGCVLKDCPQYSWSTGVNTAVDSQYQRLLAVNPQVVGYNFAHSGATMADLDGQLKAAAALGVQYVTVLMGANDLCTSSISAMTPTATFKSRLDQALVDFYGADPGGRLYLSSLPNLLQLWTLGHTNATAEKIWTLFRICQSMLSPANTDAQRQQVVAQEQAYNTVLATECAKAVAAGLACHWDNLAGYNFAFSAGDISPIDFFHPSLDGQNAIAALTWSAGYWPDL